MSDDTTPTQSASTESEASADHLLTIGQEVKRRRGRPPGSKNRPKDENGLPKVNESSQRKIFAGAIVFLFMLLGVVLGWFGYEYHDKLSTDEAEEGGTLLIPIAAKVGWIAAAAFYLSFPAWCLIKINEKFRRKVEPIAANSPATNGSPNPGSPSPVSTDNANRTPAATDSGLSSIGGRF